MGRGTARSARRAFRGALAGCVALVVVGVLMVLLADGAVASVGISLLALSGLGLLTGGGGLLAERVRDRRPGPRSRKAGGPGANGRRPN